MEKRTEFAGVSGAAWGVIGIVALVALILVFYLLDAGPSVFN